MSDDHFYARAYGRMSAVADGRARAALAVIDQIPDGWVRELIRADLERIVEVAAQIDAEASIRSAVLDERVKRRLDIIPLPVEVQ